MMLPLPPPPPSPCGGRTRRRGRCAAPGRAFCRRWAPRPGPAAAGKRPRPPARRLSWPRPALPRRQTWPSRPPIRLPRPAVAASDPVKASPHSRVLAPGQSQFVQTPNSEPTGEESRPIHLEHDPTTACGRSTRYTGCGELSGGRKPTLCHSEPAGEESRSPSLELQRTTPPWRTTQYTGRGELSGVLASPEHGILRLRAQNDRVVGGAHLTTPPRRTTQDGTLGWALPRRLAAGAQGRSRLVCNALRSAMVIRDAVPGPPEAKDLRLHPDESPVNGAGTRDIRGMIVHLPHNMWSPSDPFMGLPLV